MILVINSQGGLVSLQDEDLFQGSTQLNILSVIAPFADTVTFKAVFEMPDGSLRPDNLDGYVLQPSMKIAENLNAWKLPITFPITQNYGTVTMQLRGMIGDIVVCTTRVQFSIQRGVPYASGFEEISDKDQLLQMIADLRALINTKVDSVNYNYEIAQVNENTVGVYYVYDLENKIFVPKTLPQDYVAGTVYYKVKNIGRITNIDNGLYLEYTDEDTGSKMRLKVEGNKATLNEKQIAVLDDLVAEKIKYNNQVSSIPASNVKEALDNLKARVDNIETSQMIDLGDLVIDSSSWQQTEDGFEYKFTHPDFTSSVTQAIIFTPSDKAIDDLNENDILLYPSVEIGQDSEKVAYAILKTDKKPDFAINVHCLLQSVALTSRTAGLKASQIIFSPMEGVTQTNVQNAIEQVQGNLVAVNTKLAANIKSVNDNLTAKFVKTIHYENTTIADHKEEILNLFRNNQLLNVRVKYSGDAEIKIVTAQFDSAGTTLPSGVVETQTQNFSSEYFDLTPAQITDLESENMMFFTSAMPVLTLENDVLTDLVLTNRNLTEFHCNHTRLKTQKIVLYSLDLTFTGQVLDLIITYNQNVEV